MQNLHASLNNLVGTYFVYKKITLFVERVNNETLRQNFYSHNKKRKQKGNKSFIVASFSAAGICKKTSINVRNSFIIVGYKVIDSISLCLTNLNSKPS